MPVRKLASLGFALALVYSISLPARAELLKNFKTEGSIETRSFGIDNESDRNGLKDDYRSETNYRLMFGGTFDLLDDVHSKILLDKQSRFGGATGENLNTVQSSIFVDNAYVKVDKVFGGVDLTIGRQFYNDPSDLVIYFGPQNNDILSITSLDAFRADADIMGWAKFQGIAGKVIELGNGEPPLTVTGTNGDTDVWGGEINTDKLIPGGNLAVYYYTQQVKKTSNAVAGNNTLIDTGIRLAGDIKLIGGLGYMAEFIDNEGRNNGLAAAPGYSGSAYDIGVHYGRDVSAVPVRAHVEYARGSDDFSTIAAGRRFGIIWGEHTSVATAPSNLDRTNGAGLGNAGAGLSNLKVIDGGVGANPITKLGIDLNAYRFLYDASIGGTGTSAGTEYDLIVSWRHSENVYLEANAATFQVGTTLQNVAGSFVGAGTAPNGTSPITRLGADVKIKF